MKASCLLPGLLDVGHGLVLHILHRLGRVCHLRRLLRVVRQSVDGRSADQLRVDVGRVRQSSAILLVLGRPLNGTGRLVLRNSHTPGLDCNDEIEVSYQYRGRGWATRSRIIANDANLLFNATKDLRR